MHPPQHCLSGTKQRGAALLLMLVIVVMGIAVALVSSLSATALKNARQETTAAALAQAKEALISRAVLDENMPGSLPCPDLITNTTTPILNVPNDGVADSLSGNDCPSYIGRLPWKTLGLPDLRDGSGERLWYVLSRNFRDDNSAQPLNSDTAGTLSVSGNISVNNMIAIVFAPGRNLPEQDRSTTNINIPEAFLESIVSAHTSFRQLTTDDKPGGNFTYNDQSIFITHDALLPLVEKIVTKRVQNELFKSSRTFWRPYPFAAPFNDPSKQNSFVSASGTQYGLLPVNAVWASLPPPSVSITGEGATGSCERRENTAISLDNARLRCTFSIINGTPASSVTITGTLTPSLGLWGQHNLDSASEVRVRVKVNNNSCAEPNPEGTAKDCAAKKVPSLNAAIDYSVNADGSVAVTFTGNLISAITLIELREVVADAEFSWFTQNEWHKVMYYAISPGYNAGGNMFCTGSPPYCLALGEAENVGALIVTTGSARTGTIHPSTIIGDYLELENATPENFIYENKPRSSTFNDHVIVVAP